LALAEEVQRLGIPVEVLALAPGPLLARGYESVPIHLADWNCLEEELAGLYDRGFRAAILNSVAAGDAVQSLRDQGFRTLCLVNEMPSIISELGLEQAAAAAGAADVCIFPADIVQRRYPFPVSNYRVLPQGLLDRRLLAREHNSRRWGSPDYGIPRDIPLVLAAGYAEERKGFDLFVSAAKVSLARGLPIHFAWVGKVADHVPVIRDAMAALQELPNVTLIEFSDDYGAVLELATVFALSSREDPFPNVVVDATAVGMPVVAFQDCSGVEALLEVTHGALATEMTGEALLEAISKVLPTAASQELVAERKRYIAWRHNLTDYVGRLMETLGVNGRPEVSVAIPAFNHAPYIRERIESVIGQGVEPSEIILIDDASVDETYGRAVAALRTFRGPVLTIQRSDNSGSVFRSWISAVWPARRPFVWIAESDDACEPDFVSRMLEFQSQSDAAMTFCMARPIGEHSEPLAHSYELYLSEVFPDHDWSVPRIFEPGEFLQFAAVANPVLTVSSCLFRTEALQAALARCQEISTIGSHIGHTHR
jgi:glycosyltransferase involved in cell wall biosynthesis